MHKAIGGGTERFPFAVLSKRTGSLHDVDKSDRENLIRAKQNLLDGCFEIKVGNNFQNVYYMDIFRFISLHLAVNGFNIDNIFAAVDEAMEQSSKK